MVIKKLYNKLWSNVINCTALDNNDISAYRRIFVLVYLFILFPNALWVAEIPDALFYPPKYSLSALFQGFPPYYLLLFFHLIFLGCLVSIGLNKNKVVAGIIAFLTVIVISNFKYSLGKIDHLILLPLTLLCFSLADWSASGKSNGKGIIPVPGETLLAIFVAFGMFTAGFQKSLNWIDFDLNYSGFLAWYYPGYLSSGRTYFLASMVPDLPSILIESLDYVAIFFELIAILILLSGSRLSWKFWILIACFFHLANLLLMNIQFHVHCFVYIPFLLPKKVTSYVNQIPQKKYNVVLFLLASIQLVFLGIKNKPFMSYFLIELKPQLIMSLVLWIITFTLALIGFLGFLKTFREGN